MPAVNFIRPLLTGVLLTATTILFAVAMGDFPFTTSENKKALVWEDLPKDPLELGLKGYWELHRLKLIRPGAPLTLIDLSKPSNEERLYVIDPVQKKVLLSSIVAHGSNSGLRYAETVSNQNNSLQSSAGFFVTKQTYDGKNGYSLRLQGLQKGINDLAYDRAIVVHGARYVDPDWAKQTGWVGRSQGCPAVPVGVHKELIDLIKEKTCLFIYHPSYPPDALSLIKGARP